MEILVLGHTPADGDCGNSRLCLLKSSKRPSKGSSLLFDNHVSGVVENMEGDGLFRIRFEGVPSLERYLEAQGTMPLPPYIKRREQDPRAELDRERYQTVFARIKGAVAAPTAGLHFTDETRAALARSGIGMVEITLHVGYGTFRPVRSKDIRNHRLGTEEYGIERNAADAINLAKNEGRRVIAVGTTVVRALEAAAANSNPIEPCRGTTDLLIAPGFRFAVVDGLVTNFHLPRSSLLFLVSALAERELILEAYRHAVEKSYRFYSYGDVMLIV